MTTPLRLPSLRRPVAGDGVLGLAMGLPRDAIGASACRDLQRRGHEGVIQWGADPTRAAIVCARCDTASVLAATSAGWVIRGPLVAVHCSGTATLIR